MEGWGAGYVILGVLRGGRGCGRPGCGCQRCCNRLACVVGVDWGYGDAGVPAESRWEAEPVFVRRRA